MEELEWEGRREEDLKMLPLDMLNAFQIVAILSLNTEIERERVEEQNRTDLSTVRRRKMVKSR